MLKRKKRISWKLIIILALEYEVVSNIATEEINYNDDNHKGDDDDFAQKDDDDDDFAQRMTTMTMNIKVHLRKM